MSRYETTALICAPFAAWTVGSAQVPTSHSDRLPVAGESCTFNHDQADVPDCIHTNKSGAISISAKVVREVEFDAYGLAPVYSQRRGWMYVNRLGEVVVADVAYFDNGAGGFHDGLVRVFKNGKYGFANRNGTLVIPVRFDGAYEFNAGTSMVCNQCKDKCDHDGEHCSFAGGTWYRINPQGKVVRRSNYPNQP